MRSSWLRSWLVGLLAVAWTALAAALAAFALNERFVDSVRAGAVVFWLLPLAASIPAGLLARLAAVSSRRRPDDGAARFLGFFVTLLALPIGGALLQRQAARLFQGSPAMIAGITTLGALILAVGAYRSGSFLARILLVSGRPRGAALGFPLAILLLVPPTGAWMSRRPIAFDGEPRTLILGVDAATWWIIDSMTDRGKLPTFRKLQEEGTRFDLKSIPPLMSPILWTTIGSGVPPAQHGVESFYSSASEVVAPRIWDIVEQKGGTVGVLGWPVTWPPRPIRGFIIPSLFSQGPETYPDDLRFIRELAMLEKGGRRRDPGQYATFSVRMIQYGVKLSTFLEAARVMAGNPDFVEKTVALRRLKLLIHSDLFVELWERYKPRFASFYDNAVDVTCHYCWKYFEPASFADVTPEQGAHYGEAIYDIYEATDRAMGKILSYAPKDLLVVVVSDHGQQATETEASGAVRLIRTENFLRILGLEESVDGINLASVVHLLPKRGGALPEGIGSYLGDVVNERTGEPFFDSYTDESGNFIVSPRPGVPIAGERVIVPGRGAFPADELIQETTATISGEHSLDAILLLAGPHIRRGNRGGPADLYDVAPTTLYGMGLPVGDRMVGHILSAAFDEAYFSTTPPARESYVLTTPVPERGATADDTMLREQLRALGYLN